MDISPELVPLRRSNAVAHRPPVLILDSSEDEAGPAPTIEVGTEVRHRSGGGNTDPATTGTRARGWCFTENNPGNPDDLVQRLKSNKSVQYFVFQLERGSRQQRQHWQGYLYLKNPHRMAGVKDILGLQSAHLEVQRGTPEQASDYCKKDDDRLDGPWEHGDLPAQGKRKDLGDLYEHLREHRSLRGALEEMPAVTMRHLRAAERVLSLLEPRRDWEMQVLVYIGRPGTGKSRTARDLCRNEDVEWYTKSNNKWWDGYEGHHTVIWDDIDPEIVSIHFLLQLCDRYDMQVEVKGGMRQFLSKRIIFTTNMRFEAMYPSASADHMAAFNRRVTMVKDF